MAGVLFSGYEALAGAAAVITYLVTPQGQKASQQAFKAMADQIESIRQNAGDPKPDPERRPVPYPNVERNCNDRRRKCPVCGKRADAMVSESPPYLPASSPPLGRVPLDNETILAGPEFQRQTGSRVKGAQVYSGPGGNLYHRDTLHIGNRAEIEMYNSRGTRHLGTVCPNCGQPLDGPDPDKRIN
jgi:hypothetical protein